MVTVVVWGCACGVGGVVSLPCPGERDSDRDLMMGEGMKHTVGVERLTRETVKCAAGATVGMLAVVERMGGDMVKVCAVSKDVRRSARRKGVTLRVCLSAVADACAVIYGAERI